MFEAMVVLVAICVVIVSGMLLWSAAKIFWADYKNPPQTHDCCSSEEAMFRAAQMAMETGKPVVANYDGKKKTLETKTIE